MTSLQDTISTNKLLDSSGMLRRSLPAGGPPDQLFHTLLGGSNVGDYSTPCILGGPSPGNVLLEDLGIHNVNPFEHDMLLPSLDSTAPAALAMHGDQFTGMEHSEQRNEPADCFLTAWNPLNDQSTYLLQKDMAVGAYDFGSCVVGNGGGQTSWCNDVGQQDKTVAPLCGLVPVASSPVKRKGSEALTSGAPAPATPQSLRRSRSAKHACCKPCDSPAPEVNDAVEDDEFTGKDHELDTRNSPSKNLVSERRRRQKLNERLYSLRALVPKISKMDKASIVSDAISYVEDLRKQVDDIQADIKALESGKGSSKQASCHEPSDATTVRRALFTKQYSEHRILELEVSQMEEQTYNLRIHCKKGPGVLVQLTSALEALDLEIVNANLTSVNDHVLNTVVVKVGNGDIMTPEELKRLTLDVVPKFGLVF